ncbi:MAG: DNRLRE domain-containing protein [bacterium]
MKILPDSIDSYGKFVPLGLSDFLLLGKDEQYEARILIKFSIKDSCLDSVSSVRLILHPIDSFPVNFLCRACSTDWSTSAVTWRMADSTTQWLNPGGDCWQFVLGQGTLAKDSTIVELNRDYLDTLVRHSYGLILFPVDTGFTAVANLTSAQSGPRLILTFADSKTRLYYPVEDAHIVDSSGIRTNPFDLLVGSSFAFRTWLWFQLDSIPPEATIARAELIFKPRTVYRRTDTLHIGIHQLTESYGLRGKYASFKPSPSATVAYVPPDTDTTVSLEISRLMQDWVSKSDSNPNYGILITAEPEWLKPFRLKLFRTGQASPRLQIQYLLPPEDRFSR